MQPTSRIKVQKQLAFAPNGCWIDFAPFQIRCALALEIKADGAWHSQRMDQVKQAIREAIPHELPQRQSRPEDAPRLEVAEGGHQQQAVYPARVVTGQRQCDRPTE